MYLRPPLGIPYRLSPGFQHAEIALEVSTRFSHGSLFALDFLINASGATVLTCVVLSDRIYYERLIIDDERDLSRINDDSYNQMRRLRLCATNSQAVQLWSSPTKGAKLGKSSPRRTKNLCLQTRHHLCHLLRRGIFMPCVNG